MSKIYNRIGKLAAVLCLLLSSILVPVLPAKVAKAEMQTVYKKRELRAAWISTVWNMDWPKSVNNQAAQKAEFISLLGDLKAMGMNAVIVQVRPMGDALYPTTKAPWSQFLTGKQGQSPGYDPLQFMIAEAHKRNLEFHAWFNPFRISSTSTDVNTLADSNPAKQHPEWKVDYNNGMYYNPGIPEVRTFIKDTILEVVNKYDIDAVHLDDYFYPDIKNAADFNDAQTFAQYNNGFTNLGDWRRNNIDMFVKDLSDSIKKAKPYVKFGISPNGIWKNIPYGSGQYTTGMESYNRVYADSVKWVKQNWIDYITPQIYWKFGHKAAPYEVLTQWWKEQVKGTNVQLYIGHADYKLGTSSSLEDWTNAYEEIPNQIKFDRENGIQGGMHFRAGSLQSNVLGIKDRLKNDVYKYPALVPTTPTKDSTPPAKPGAVAVKRTSQGVSVSWNAASDAAYYAIYRFKQGETQDINDATKLLGTVHKSQGTAYVDKTAAANQEYVYAVTAVDRLHNESQPVFVKTIAPIKTTIDEPAANAQVKGIATVRGWALADSGVAKVEVLIDGKPIGAAKYGLSRLDVYKVFPQYNTQNSGFEYKLDTKLLKQGSHTLGIRTTANNGVQSTSTIQISVVRQLPIRTTIDDPSENAQISGTQKVRGWALAEDGVAKVEVLVDGTLKGAATLGLLREDVYKVYPNYNNKNSGYEYLLNTKTLTQGAHTITVRTTTKSGDVQTVNRKVNVVRELPVLLTVDTPANNAQVASNYRVKGWALAEDGIAKAEVFVDGVLQGQATLGLSRPDVYKVYPKYNNQNSGFEYFLNTKSLSAGTHKLTVTITTTSGDKKSAEINVQVVKLPIRISIDQPAPNQAVDQVQTVKGWALAESGVSKVEILVDGAVKGQAQYGLSRADVANVFPLYNNQNSGFTYSLDTSSLTKGNHTMTVRVTDKDGKVQSASTTILISPLHGKVIVVDPGHGGYWPGAMGGGYKEKDWTLSVGLKLRDLLEAQGATVIMTRAIDKHLYFNSNEPNNGLATELKMRAQISNDAKADAFVSLHFNSGGEGSPASGIETYHQSFTAQSSIDLATSIQNALIKKTGANDRGVKAGDLSVLRNNERPAALAELGFISNPVDRVFLATPGYQQKLAEALRDGLYNYFD